MEFVFLFQPAQDRNGVFDRRFRHKHRLEPSGQCGVFFDMFAVFIQRGRADAMQFAACQSGFEQVGGIHCPFALARAHQRVHFIDEQDDVACRSGHFRQNGLQPLLEFTAIFGPCNQRAHIERQELLVLEAFGHIAIDDPQGEALGDGGFADARLADQHGIVFGAAREHLNGAADFLVAADHRIKLAVAGGLGQIARIFFQGIIGAFRIRAVGGAAFAQIADCLIKPFAGDARFGERLSGFHAGVCRNRQQQPLGGHELVIGVLRQPFRAVEQPDQVAGRLRLRGGRTADARHFGDQRIGMGQSGFGVAARIADQARRHALAVIQQGFEHMFGGQLRMAFAHRNGLGGLDKAFGTVGIFFEIHDHLLWPPAPFLGHGTRLPDVEGPAMATPLLSR